MLSAMMITVFLVGACVCAIVLIVWCRKSQIADDDNFNFNEEQIILSNVEEHHTILVHHNESDSESNFMPYEL